MNIQVNVINQKLKIATNIKSVVAGTQKFIRFEFIFDDGWHDLKTFAQFRQNNEAYNIYLDNDNAVYLPPEIDEGFYELSLYGTSGTVIAVTDTLKMNAGANNLVADASSTEITKPLYNQIIDTVSQIEKGATYIPNVSDHGVISWTNEIGLDNPNPVDITGPKGDAGVGIALIEQTEYSGENGGANVITVTLTDGRTETFTIRNGIADTSEMVKVDATLKNSGQAADAYVVGKKFEELSGSATSYSLTSSDDGMGNVTISLV